MLPSRRLEALNSAAAATFRSQDLSLHAFPLVLVFAVIYVYAPLSLEEVAKLPWLDDINIIVNKSLAPAKPEAGVSPVDPVAAGMSTRTWTIE